MMKAKKALSLVLLLVLALTLIPSAVAGSSAVVPVQAQEGTIKWQWETDSDVCMLGSPAIGPDGNIYVTAYGGTATWVPARLFCVSPQGSMLWKSQELDHIGASDPVIGSDGTIYVVGYYKLYAFNPGGSLKWEWTTPEDGDPYPHAQICGATLGADGTIYTSHCGAGSYHRHLFALNPDGSMKWAGDLADPNIGNGIGALTVGKDGVLYGQGTHWVNYSIYAFDPDNGAVLWSTELGSSVNQGGMAIGSDGTIYVPLAGGTPKLAAITPDGTMKWEYDMATPGIPSIGSDGAIYVTGGKLYALTSSGQLKWTASDGSTGAPEVAIASDGTIYSRLFHSEKEQHLLTAVNPDGSIEWLVIPIPFEAGTPAIGSDGTIYVTGGCRPGVLTAVDGSGPLVSSDSDGDGVPDDEDWCDDTPLGTEVDEDGCPVDVLDSDDDAYAQTSVTLQSFYGEGSYQDGYDFSTYAVQRWGEGGPDNPSLSPDFYLGDPFTPLTTSESPFDPKHTIDYGVIPLASITEIPDHTDSRFASNNFVAGQTYGMFTNEGDYVVLQVVDTVEEFVDNDLTIRMTFNWVYVEGGLTGELTISLYPYDRSEFALGDSPTIGGDVLVGGQPVANAQVCTEVRGDAGEYMYGACHFTDANGQFSFWLEYGVSIPTGYRGNLVVEADVAYNDTVAEQTIYVPYGNEALDLPLDLVLFGPDHSIEIGGWEDIGIAGTITSQGMNVDGALVTMKVAGQTFQTTTGTHTSGSFNWYWANNSFPAGNYWVDVTITKDGYQSVTDSVPFTLIGAGYNYWVTMDPIPATLDPGINVAFPGTLTLGGNPVSDWIDIYITFPNGRTNGYSNLTDTDGRFTHTQPSLPRSAPTSSLSITRRTANRSVMFTPLPSVPRQPQPQPSPLDHPNLSRSPRVGRSSRSAIPAR